MTYTVSFTFTSPLPRDLGHIPISATIDFGALLRDAGAGAPARLDPTSVEVIDLDTGAAVPHHLAEDFAHGDRGRVEFAVRAEAGREPSRRFQIRFAAVPPNERRSHLAPRAAVPPIGVGDLLRHNGDRPRPVAMFCFHLVDLDGDGRAHLAGTWNYYHRPGEPRSGVVVYPRVDHDESPLCFGDQVRLGWREAGDLGVGQPFAGTYVEADFGDLSGDGLPDMVFAEWNTGRVEVYRQTGEYDGGGWPVWERGHQIAVPEARIESLSLVDLDGDGILDLVFNGVWIRNTNPDGWPFQPGVRLDLGAGERVAFVDITGDGRLDLVGLESRPSALTDDPEADDAWPGCDAFWCQHLADATPRFAPRQPLRGLPPSTHRIAAARDGERAGLLVQHGIWQEISFFEVGLDPEAEGAEGSQGSLETGGAEAAAAAAAQVAAETQEATAAALWARLEAPNPPLTFSDQSWPCACDWDGDGITDLVIGGGYGWPRLVRNEGTNAAPRWGAPQLILSENRPIRLQRDEILPGAKHWHNMGYPYPSVVDWDGDGRPDLMLPNETNRIYWYRNVGTRQAPVFGPRQQLVVDGYEDSVELREHVGRLALERDLPNHPYPFDDTSPFFWRTGACFADFTGDGSIDLVTLDEHRKLALFVQYVDATGQRRLRKERRLKLVDGRKIDDRIVDRQKHWTESFRAVDWDGDGLLDLIYSTSGSGHIYLLRNVGSATDPVFAPPRQFRLYGEPFTPFTVHGPNCWPVDLNDDGRPDLLGCVEWSAYPFFAHAALEMERHPEWELGPVRRLAP